jgi:hypothetical protein
MSAYVLVWELLLHIDPSLLASAVSQILHGINLWVLLVKPANMKSLNAWHFGISYMADNI